MTGDAGASCASRSRTGAAPTDIGSREVFFLPGVKHGDMRILFEYPVPSGLRALSARRAGQAGGQPVHAFAVDFVRAVSNPDGTITYPRVLGVGIRVRVDRTLVAGSSAKRNRWNILFERSCEANRQELRFFGETPSRIEVLEGDGFAADLVADVIVDTYAPIKSTQGARLEAALGEPFGLKQNQEAMVDGLLVVYQGYRSEGGRHRPDERPQPFAHFRFEKDGERMGYAGGGHRHDWKWKGYSIAFLSLGFRVAVLRVEKTAP